MRIFFLFCLILLHINFEKVALGDSEKGYSSTKEMFEDQYKKFVVLQKIVQKDLSVSSTRNLKYFPDIDELNKICKLISILSLITDTGNYEYKNYDNTTDNFIYNSSDAPRLEIFFNKDGAVIFGYHNRADINPHRLIKTKEILIKQKYGLKKDKIENYFFDFNEKQILNLLPYFNEKKCWKGVLDNLPEEFLKYKEKFFVKDSELYEISFCIWRKYSDKQWNIGSIEFPIVKNNGISTQETYPYVFDSIDGSGELLWNINKKPERLMETLIESNELWDEFEEGDILNYDSVKKLYRIKNLSISEKIIREINPKSNISNIERQILETGYSILKNKEKELND